MLKQDTAQFRTAANLAGAGQAAFEEALMRIFRWLSEEKGADEILFAGGIALNCVANGVLSQQLKNTKITVPAHPDDGGTSIGASIAGQYFLQENPRLPKITSYCGIGTEAWSESNFSDDWYVKKFTDTEESQLIDLLVQHLETGKAIGVYRGRSEFGPRALGNRSILFDPRNDQAANLINSNIKGREWYRPVAPVVLYEFAQEYFETQIESKYMEFAQKVRSETASRFPGGVHVDQTARLQTVRQEDNPFFYKIIQRFYEKTGVPIVINTSLNLKNRTIIDSAQEALEMLECSDLFGILIEDTWVSKHDN